MILNASVIHDLFENAATLPGVTEHEITRIDADGPAVYSLVMEMTIRKVNGVKELKADYLTRVMRQGSRRAQVLKLADGISNLTALGFVHDAAFVARYVKETRAYIPAACRSRERGHVSRALGSGRQPRAPRATALRISLASLSGSA